ncbi:MAG: molybdopterin-dependent oxidoreductase [Dehalococcoidales bacterium]|nr:molybdopterin-dependent oxidoreductase [Dehalococcoidales bacterium]
MMDEKIINTSCSHDCGGRCVLKPHVKDGKIVRFESDTGEDPQLRACLRGRAYRQQVYAPDRLQYPMKRTGERGEGKFARISWDEALDTVAREMLRIKKTYGNSSILFLWGGGSQAVVNGAMAAERMLAMFGGYTRPWGAASYEGPLFASMATYGTMNSGSARIDHLNSKLIIMWGWNPAVTIWDPNTAYTMAQAKEKGIRIISIDPRMTETTATFADEWVPIHPGTDAAMVIAMAYVIIEKNLQDQKFLDTFTLGFDKFKSYVLGADDGIPKTPQWAEKITSVPAATIERIAIEYATNKPAVLIPGWGPSRGTMGEQFMRAACTVIAMTGNIGKEGGYAGGFMRAFHSREMSLPKTTKNAVETGSAHRANSLYKIRGAGHPTAARMHETHVYDAIMKGKAGGYPCDPKMAYIVASDYLNSRPNVNAGIAAFKKLEFVVVHEQRMTPTARFADILLPVNTFMEREDITPPWLGSPYYLYVNPVIPSLYESKSDFEICAALAPRLGIANYTEGKDVEGWLRVVSEHAGDIADFDTFKKDGVVKLKVEPFVAFKKEISDPAHHPFNTPSGKIELYSESLAEWRNPQMPPIAQYIPASEGYGDPLQKKYPLQLLTSHHKPATHSTLEKIPWLEETEPRRLWLNSQDAKARGISNNDEIIAFNDRGKVRIRAYVTDRIIPGAVCLPHGGWFEIDENGVDIGGCDNTLTPSLHSPGGAWPANTALVEVKKA